MKRPAIPTELRELMKEAGQRWSQDIPGHVRVMIEKFSEVLRAAPCPEIKVTRDIQYGEHPRQALDIFLPEQVSAPAAALLFVHGGAFLDGNRNRSEEIYSNVLRFFARHGIIGVNIGYRLAGDAMYPGATQDVAAAVRWVRDHAEEIGVDAENIFLMGHSAGCAHIGSYAYDKRLHPQSAPGVRGLVIVSGRVRAEMEADNPNARKVEAYYGTADAEKLDDYSALSHVDAGSIPTFVAWGEYENPLIDVHCAELVYRLGRAKRRTPPMMWLKGHNHTSTIAHFNTAEDDLGRAILAFMAESRG
jgi:acetyl esterase